MRIPIRLSRTNGSSGTNGSGIAAHANESVFFQDTIIEFGTPREVLFAVNRPLEFADRVLVEPRRLASRRSLRGRGSVSSGADRGCCPLP